VSLSQGSTFVNNPSPRFPSHLWIIISDLTQDKDRVVIVNVSTWRDKALMLNDESCIIEKGEHSFIQKKSYIFYKEAKVTSENSLQNGLNGGALIPYEDCSIQLLERILAGTMQTTHLSNEIIGILQTQGLID
jgi:hypothetical protein